MYEYFVTPKRVNLISTRSQTPYWDRLIILVELQSKKLKEGNDAFKLWWTLPAYLGYAGNGLQFELNNEQLRDRDRSPPQARGRFQRAVSFYSLHAPLPAKTTFP